MSGSLAVVSMHIEVHLNDIARLFKKGAKLTLLVRAPSDDEADFIMTIDDITNIRAALDRRFGACSQPPEMSSAATDVVAERARQISQEGWTIEHDDEHDPGVLASGACAYSLHAADVLFPHSQGDGGWGESPPHMWMWSAEWWRPTTPRRDLVKAGALILAEIEKLDRAVEKQ